MDKLDKQDKRKDEHADHSVGNELTLESHILSFWSSMFDPYGHERVLIR
jgi:hypothetical protein